MRRALGEQQSDPQETGTATRYPLPGPDVPLAPPVVRGRALARRNANLPLLGSGVVG